MGSGLKAETKSGLWAVGCLALALFFILASLDYAGAAGRLTYAFLDQLLGTGFLVIPLALVLMGLAFLKIQRPAFIWKRLIAGAIFFLAALATFGFLFPFQEALVSGGLVGQLIAAPLNRLFGGYSLILLAAILLGSILVIFDARLRLPKLGLTWLHRLLERRKTIKLTRPPTEASPLPLPEESGGVAETPVAPAVEETSIAEMAPPKPPRQKPLLKVQYTPPPLALLSSNSGRPTAGDIKANVNIIKRTLQNFGISVEMDEVSIGPSITRYTLKPAEGVRLAKIVALQNDLSLALAAHPLRIEAPIPGKSLVGIEIPNKVKSTVGLASLLAAPRFTEAATPLLLSLGSDISGQPHFADLGRAPHLLIAGSTGSGKSILVHSFILSLLYRNSPERLRLILIDPKRVELPLYNRLPHLLTPVVTDPKKVIAALRWAGREMEKRYLLLETFQVRDVASYHKNVLEAQNRKQSTKHKAQNEAQNEEEGLEELPYIVIVIDELADIMALYPRELEAAIIRLAQMSRATGIHLILSTQRPSVEVITGLIKANIPSRIALQTISQVDSRTILDMAGAEKLLGAGDLLYLSAEMAKPVRLQGALVSEEEVKRVVDFLAKQAAGGEPIELNNFDQDPKIIEPPAETEETEDFLYGAARDLVVKAGKASASYLQRKLKIGYARAARLLDLLEEAGVIGPADGSRWRVVYKKEVHEHDAPGF